MNGEAWRRQIESELDDLEVRLNEVAKVLHNDEMEMEEKWHQLGGGLRRAFGNASEANRQKRERVEEQRRIGEEEPGEGAGRGRPEIENP